MRNSKGFTKVFATSALVATLMSSLTSGQLLANPVDSGDKSSSEAANSDLVVTTWNVEHLAYPASTGCRPRTPDEMAELQKYAQSLQADIVALQEVASKKAIEQLFPADEWQIFVSDRADSEPYTCRKTGFTSTQQKVAFAVRKGIKVTGSQSNDDFGLEMRGLRYGLELNVESGWGPMTLLNLHLKSGCFVDNYTRSDSEHCQVFAQQAPILDKWVEQKESEGNPYIILGDFNHRLSANYNHLTRQLTDNSDNSGSSLNITTSDLISCHPYYPAPIDHVLVGNLTAKYINKNITVHPFEDMDPDAMLSDHCALSLHLEEQFLPISSAVKWQTRSKEYAFLTQSIYRQATANLMARDLPDESWVVVMDIDETILDNSAYQVERDSTGTFYSSATWAEWVKREEATLVPGVKGFIEAVLKRGGKLALVTNRRRTLDNHTWINLQEQGIPVTLENTCLMGRSNEDKEFMGQNGIINDKDLRRQQIKNGTASCYKSGKAERHSDFKKQVIVMQVGDNIEDFATVLQHDADLDSLVPRATDDLILLPNPMYGSWR